MNKKIIAISILLAILNITIVFSALQYIITIEGYGIVKTPIPQTIEVYQDEECTIKLSDSSLLFPEYTMETGVEQTLTFYVRNNLNKNVSLSWKLNSNTLNLGKWRSTGISYGYEPFGDGKIWTLKLYWDYPSDVFKTDEHYILQPIEIHKITCYLACPYDHRGDCSFIIDLIAEEM